MYSYTAAHPTLPFGSYLKVINLDNKLEVFVTVNDRGPFVDSRIIDLSFAAAKSLDMVEKGTANVDIYLCGKIDNVVSLQLGAFLDKSRAYSLLNEVKDLCDAFVTMEGKFYKVLCAPMPIKKAKSVRKMLEAKGYKVFERRR